MEVNSGASISQRDLAGSFQQFFELVPAFTSETVEQVHRIRHDVYCKDLGWEPVRSDGLEMDRYDEHSLHCLLRRRGTGDPVGCVRLILALPDAPEELLPFELSCADSLDRGLLDPAKLPRRSIGEVSRLAVLGAYRQRKGEAGTAAAISEHDFANRGGHQARFPFIPVSLFLGAAALARAFGIEHVFVLTEPRLASHFVRIGFDIQSVGGAIDHRGSRVPSLLNSFKVVAGLRPIIRPLYAVIDAGVEQAIAAHPEVAARLRLAWR